jgi:AcrR family transcriptional regulator
MAPRAGIAETDARTRLRDAALERFGRQGLHGTSTREIIADAGLRNPSAISYYFGSKVELIDELVREVNRDRSRIIQQQVALAEASEVPAPEQWVDIAIEAALGMLTSERDCLFVRVWSDRDAESPDAVEVFLAGDHPLAVAWRAAVARTFPDLPLAVSAARCVVLLRTLQFFAVRRARRILEGSPIPLKPDMDAARVFLRELGTSILTAPTTLTSVDLV